MQALRSDCRRRLEQLAGELALRASWTSWTSWPGWDRLMQVSGWCRSSVASWLRQLRLLGWLSVVESGSTPRTRPLTLAHVEGHRRAVYALRVPQRTAEPVTVASAPESAPSPAPMETAVPDELLDPPRGLAAIRSLPVHHTHSHQQIQRIGDESWTPTWSFKSLSQVGGGVSSRARHFFHNSQLKPHVGQTMEALRARFEERWTTFGDRAPTSRAEAYAAACELRRQHPVAARLSATAVRALARPYWRAGWSNGDVLHALEYRPTSWSTLPAMDPARVIAPYRWLQSRLSAWRTDLGRVLPGHSHAERTRRNHARTIADRHGRGALAGLPAGTTQLRAADVTRRGHRQHAAAAELLRRRRAGELTDARAAQRPAAEIASPARARQAAAQIRAEHARRQAEREQLRDRLLAQARAAAEHEHQAVSKTTWTPPRPAETPADTYERALQRARTEGHRSGAKRHRRPGR